MTELPLPQAYFKKEAKRLLLAVQSNEPTALSRITPILTNPSEFSLVRAQHVVAVESGFAKWENIVTSSAVELHLVITMAKVPQLHCFGIGYMGDDRKLPKEKREAKFMEDRKALRASVEDVERTVNWLRTNVASIKTLNSRRSSYGIKHVAERDIGYITNGVLIAAGVMTGYSYRLLLDWDSPNVHFGMSEKSLKAIERRQGIGA